VFRGDDPPEERRCLELLHEHFPLFFVGVGVQQLGGAVRGGMAAAEAAVVFLFLVGAVVGALAAEIVLVRVSSHFLFYYIYIYNKLHNKMSSPFTTTLTSFRLKMRIAVQRYTITSLRIIYRK